MADTSTDRRSTASRSVGIIAQVSRTAASARASRFTDLEGGPKSPFAAATKVSVTRRRGDRHTPSPEHYELEACRLEALHGGNPDQSALDLKAILDGNKVRPGNGLAYGGARSLRSGRAATIRRILLAAESIDSGKRGINLRTGRA